MARTITIFYAHPPKAEEWTKRIKQSLTRFAEKRLKFWTSIQDGELLQELVLEFNQDDGMNYTAQGLKKERTELFLKTLRALRGCKFQDLHKLFEHNASLPYEDRLMLLPNNPTDQVPSFTFHEGVLYLVVSPRGKENEITIPTNGDEKLIITSKEQFDRECVGRGVTLSEEQKRLVDRLWNFEKVVVYSGTSTEPIETNVL